jgi:hypothetical protein
MKNLSSGQISASGQHWQIKDVSSYLMILSKKVKNSPQILTEICHFYPLRAAQVYHFLCCSSGQSIQNTAVFANFVQFHHVSLGVGRKHITSFITGRRPADLQPFYRPTEGGQQFVSFLPAGRFASLFTGRALCCSNL